NDIDALSLILDGIPAAIMMVDASGACVYLNHECTSITGYTLEDARADQAVCREICSIAMNGARGQEGPWDRWTGPIADRESLIRCKDGRITQVRLRATSISSDRTIVTLTPHWVAHQGEGGLAGRQEHYRGLIEN